MKQDAATRARLLEVAERLFAERGFKKVTVRDICRAAHANVASVNYYFGDKLGLYREVLQRAIDGMRTTNESVRLAGLGLPPEERLRRGIEILVTVILSAHTGTLHKLIQREVTDPTPVLDALVEQGIRPRIEYLASVVSALAGVPVSDPRVLRCVASIQTQLTAYFPHPISARLGFSPPTTPAAIKATADHIAEFSIGGVRAIGSRAHQAKDARRTRRAV